MTFFKVHNQEDKITVRFHSHALNVNFEKKIIVCIVEFEHDFVRSFIRAGMIFNTFTL